MRTWNDYLKIGIPLLDCQHEQLLDQMDQLLAAIDNHKGDQELRAIMGFLKMYTNNHFNYEESCMNSHKCPVACDNKKAHTNFLTTLQDINSKIDQKQPLNLIRTQVKQELVDWFVNHIKNIDTQLKSHIPTK
ncbi:Hemerythrin-like metal-binding protein [Planktothrix sp. PCC 11201]|uniref:bacteriohemerythrin n=1 Tax=Planktothrix sp. PCC 11201 TaxID=1729650 RepID=UPI000920D830|nr:hemerythrin family protein [Planktothrix sp. PCC 11201]SKB11828.1 Hemerythrin-like metal-binding protein [Planktothrix sp. PCC 11201]